MRRALLVLGSSEGDCPYRSRGEHLGTDRPPLSSAQVVSAVGAAISAAPPGFAASPLLENQS